MSLQQNRNLNEEMNRLTNGINPDIYIRSHNQKMISRNQYFIMERPQNLLLWINIVIYIYNVTAFKSDFTYMSQIFLNTSSWDFKMTYNFSQLDELVRINRMECKNADIQLNELENTLSLMNSAKGETTKHFVLNDSVTFNEATNQCNRIGPNCELAKIQSRPEYNDILKLILTHNIKEGHLNYVIKDGELMENGQQINTKHYIFGHEIQIKSCPKSYTLSEEECIRPYTVLLNRYEAYDFCARKDSELFILKNAHHLQKLKKLNIPPNTQIFWLGGDYDEHTYPVTQNMFCQHTHDRNLFWNYQPEGDRYLTYHKKHNCIDDVGLFKNEELKTMNRHAPICTIEATYKRPAGSTDILFHRRMHDNFRDKPGSLSFTADGIFKVHYQSDKLPAICTCTINPILGNLHGTLKQTVTNKVKIVRNSIKERCKMVLNPIDKSPYIHTDLNGNSRTKRMISSMMKLAFSGVKTSLKSTNFIPKLKKLTAITGAAATLGSTTVAIYDYTQEQEFRENVLNNMESPSESLKEANQIGAYDLDGYRTNSYKKLKDKITNEYFQNITNTFYLNTQLASASILLDNIQIFVEQSIQNLKMHYDAFMGIIDTIITNIPAHNTALQKSIIKANEKLPDGYSFMSDNILNILEAAEVFHNINDTHVTAIIKTPIINSDGSLYLFKATALPYQTGSNFSVKPHFEKSYIASGYNYYALLDAEDLLACQYKNNYLCSNLNLYSNEAETCLFSHFISDEMMAAQVCHYYKLQNESMFVLTKDHKLHFYVPKPEKAYIACATTSIRNAKSSVILQGTGEYQIPQGCSIYIDNFVGVNPKMPTEVDLPKEIAPVQTVNKLLNLPIDTSWTDDLYINSGIRDKVQTIIPSTVMIYFGYSFLIFLSLFAIMLCCVVIDGKPNGTEEVESQEGSNCFTKCFKCKKKESDSLANRRIDPHSFEKYFKPIRTSTPIYNPTPTRSSPTELSTFKMSEDTESTQAAESIFNQKGTLV